MTSPTYGREKVDETAIQEARSNLFEAIQTLRVFYTRLFEDIHKARPEVTREIIVTEVSPEELRTQSESLLRTAIKMSRASDNIGNGWQELRRQARLLKSKADLAESHEIIEYGEEQVGEWGNEFMRETYDLMFLAQQELAKSGIKVNFRHPYESKNFDVDLAILLVGKFKPKVTPNLMKLRENFMEFIISRRLGFGPKTLERTRQEIAVAYDKYLEVMHGRSGACRGLF